MRSASDTDAARAPTVAAAYLFLSISSLPASQGEWECRKARFQVLLVAPLYFHVSGSYVEIAASDPADAPSGDVGRIDTTSWSSGLPLGVIYRSRIILSYA